MSSSTSATLHLLWLTEHYYPGQGGMARSCDRIVRGLRAAGATVDVAHLTGRGADITAETRRNGRDIICPLGTNTAHTLNLLWNWLAPTGAAPRYTHVVAFGGHVPLLAGPAYAAWLGAPFVAMLRGNDFDLGIFTPGRRDTLVDAIERAARVAVVSQEKFRRVRALFPRSRPVWIPNGIDLADWERLPSHRRQAIEWRASMVPAGRHVFGLIGQIKPKKGAVFFLDALRDSGHADRVHMLLVGDIDPEIASWLESHRHQVSATVVPFVDRYELLAYYSACDLVVLPSLYDGLPNVLLEAAALGIPALASTAGGMADILIDERHGFLFAPGNASACRQTIGRAAGATTETLERMGEACQELVASRLTHHLETRRYLLLFAETAAGATTGAADGER